MFLHLSIPGFHAAVHQAASAALRDRPVAVAVDAGEQAPLFAVSLEGRSEGVWPG
ncbi:MAG: DNA polymerase IV, partial [Planctomycetes bacterium]|nr:DNA polymerase IV [Planctomycetota bacterium]